MSYCQQQCTAEVYKYSMWFLKTMVGMRQDGGLIMKILQETVVGYKVGYSPARLLSVSCMGR